MTYSPFVIVHISAGTLALFSGAAALSLRKGARLHRAAGNVFFLAMLTMSAVGAYLAVLLPERLSVIAGVFTFYLVATAWATVIRKEGTVGLFEFGAAPVAIAAAVADFAFGLQASASKTGVLDGFPPQPFFVFAGVAALAAMLDVRMIVRGGVSGAQRIARHLWRMCAALFVAAASLFLGQMQVFPEPIREIYFLAAPPLAVLVLLFVWLIRVRFTGWYGKAG